MVNLDYFCSKVRLHDRQSCKSHSQRFGDHGDKSVVNDIFHSATATD